MSAGGPRLREPSGPEAARVLAVVRIAALPVFLLGERLVRHPEPAVAPFHELLAAYAAFALAALWLSLRPAPRGLPTAVAAGVDLVAICALTYTSGGAFSQLRLAFLLVPLGAAVLLPPRPTALVSLATVAAYLAVSLPHPATEGPRALEFELVQALYLAWVGVAAVGLSWLLSRRAGRIEELSALRGRLVAQALEAEERERRRLADALHDESIQNLLAARQELPAALRGDGDARETVELGLDRTLTQLRDAVFDLHPYLLDHAGLEAALRAVAERQGHRGRFRCRLDVDATGLGPADAQLVLSLARELLVNAARHAQARTVSLAVRRRHGDVELEVSDDGRGLDPEQARRALLAGHIGLASAAERVEALGGRLEIGSRPGGGTRVRARFPAGAPVASGGLAGAV